MSPNLPADPAAFDWVRPPGNDFTSEMVSGGWLDLLARDPVPNAFLHPGLLLTPGLAGERPLIYARPGPSGDPAALGGLAALAPKTVTLGRAPGLSRAMTVRGHRLVGNRVLGDQGSEALADFTDAVADLFAARRSDGLLIEDLEADAALGGALEEASRRRRELVVFPLGEPQPHWAIVFPDQPARYWDGLSKKTRYNLRRSARLFESTLLCYREEGRVPELLAKAHDVSKESWQARRLGVRVKNTANERALWGAAARGGVLRSYVLEHEGRPAAFVLGLQWGGCFLYEEIGYRLADAAHSPGTVLLVRLLEDLIARDTPRRLDFGHGDADYKRVFANHRTTSGPVLVVRRALRPMLAVRLSRARSRLSRSLRAAADRLGVREVLRRLYRR